MIYEIYTENGTKKKRALTGNGYGLPLGTWISYEGTCPDGFIESEQTFNTTTYASLYAMLGTNKVPARFDHNRPSDLETLSFTAGADITLQYDGVLYLEKSQASSTAGRITLDNVEVGNIFTNANTYDHIVIPFKKGQVLNISYSTYIVARVTYYKRHLAIKATPAYVEPDTVSNMVNTLRTQDSYSTSEVNTGKKWIDGKPIYRRTFYSANASINNSTQLAVPNIDVIVNQGVLYRTNSSCTPMIIKNGSDASSYLTLKWSSEGTFIDGISWSVDYTKTTD
jgi:hypothetical protein